MSRKSSAQMAIDRIEAINRELSEQIEMIYKEGETYAQSQVDRLALGHGGISPFVQQLLSSGKLSDRKGVYILMRDGKIISVSLYPNGGRYYKLGVV